MSKTYIVGDIHGCYYTLLDVLSEIRKTYEKGDNLVFLGDYFDRGKYSAPVYATLRNLENQFKESNVVLLRGNHEQMWLDAIDNDDSYLWLCNGGQITIDSFAEYDIEEKEVREWLSKLPYAWYDCENNLYCVHSYLPHLEIEDFNKEEKYNCIWKRSISSVGARVFHGHTPYINSIVMSVNDINLDTGCIFGGGLSFAIVEKKRVALTTIPTHSCDKRSN